MKTYSEAQEALSEKLGCEVSVIPSWDGDGKLIAWIHTDEPREVRESKTPILASLIKGSELIGSCVYFKTK